MIIWEKVRTYLGKVSTPTLFTAQAKKLLATAAFLVFMKIIQIKGIKRNSITTWILASTPQVDSFIPPVVAHGVNTISAPFSPNIVQLKMSKIKQRNVTKKNN